MSDQPTSSEAVPLEFVPAPDFTTATQAELFPAVPGLELLEPPEVQQGRYSAERVKRNRGLYDQIVKALGQGLGVRMICDAFGVHHHTVRAIREREPHLIATEKKRMSSLLGHTARLCVESFADDLTAGRVPPTAKPVAAGIFLDKKERFDGDNILRIEVRTGPSISDLVAELKALPATSESVSEGNPPK